MKRIESEDILLQALTDPIGIKVTTNDPARLRRVLYNTIHQSLDKEMYSSLTFKFPPERDQLWIIKKEALNGQ